MKLPEFSVKQPIATLMLFLAFIMIGAYSITRLSVDMFPQIDPPVISILTSWPGASASDVETEVTEAIEDWVNTVNNLDTLTSKSLDNLSVISCKFDWGSDLDVASNDIRDQLEMAKRDLPDDIEKPILFKFSSSTAPILFITVTGTKSWPRLFQLVDKEIADGLKRVPGVGGIMVYGGQRRQINVYFDMARIQGYHLSLAQINRALEAENLNIPAGSIEVGSKDYFVRIPGRYQTIGDIQNTIVGYFDNRPIYLKDIATVMDDYETIQMNAWGDGGEPGVILILQKQTGKNTVDVIERAKKKLEEFKKTLPSDVQVNIVIDGSEDILKMVKNLRDTLYYGIFFVVCVSIFFLRRIRTSIIIVATIPFSLIIAFIFLFMSEMTINIVSLMALAVASGMVVDNAIVVLENITRHMEKGGRVKTSAMFGASEMGLAITASTMTTVVVFVPLMFLTGLPGIIFGQMGYVVTITLMGSLLASLMLTPMMASNRSNGLCRYDNLNGFSSCFAYAHPHDGFKNDDSCFCGF